MTEAHRERPVPTTCVCRLRGGTVNLGNGEPHTIYDSCGGSTSGPDEPVCLRCIANGHPEQDNFDPTIKNVRSSP